jgi:hypothetical protein
VAGGTTVGDRSGGDAANNEDMMQNHVLEAGDVEMSLQVQGITEMIGEGEGIEG